MCLSEDCHGGTISCELAEKLINATMGTFSLTEAEFKEFEPRLKFETRLNYGWFHLELYSMFQDLSRRSIETGVWRI